MRKLFTSVAMLCALSTLIFAQTLLGGNARLGGQGVVRRAAAGGGGTFPNTSILDNFNRANEGPPPSANWTSSVFTTHGGVDVLSNEARGTTAGENSAWWNVATFSPNQEAYATVASGGYNRVFLRLANPGTAGVDGYFVQIHPFSDTISIYRIDDGSLTQLGSDIAQVNAAGDSWGATIIGSTITVWFKPAAGSWTSIGTRSDSTYSAAGYIGFLIEGVNLMDDFGGGTIP